MSLEDRLRRLESQTGGGSTLMTLEDMAADCFAIEYPMLPPEQQQRWLENRAEIERGIIAANFGPHKCRQL